MDARTRKTSALTLAGAVAAAVLSAAAVLLSGIVDISALQPHHPLTRWILSRGMRASVARHSAAVSPPAVFSARARPHGFIHYDLMCAGCHGAPGIEQSEAGRGMRPGPPDLAKAVPQLEDREIFWIVQNGIRFTGMPAYGPTRSEKELWWISAFLRDLPEVTPERYRELRLKREKQTGHDHCGGGR